jgi:hypothetical protein
MLWTFQPKREQSIRKHLPFITWPVQDECIDWLIQGIRHGGDRLVDKSREMGASWIILGCFFNEWLLVPDSTLMVASRKEEYVWKKGNPDTLFWKLLYMHKNLPVWCQPPMRAGFELTERHMLNPWNNSVIDGESTNADVGAGGRRQAVMLDEFSRVEAAVAESIQDAISDTTPCRIFNSTPTSRGHPFGKIRFSGKVPVFTMPWWRHPWKAQGLYRTPDLNLIEIYDLDYYNQVCPEVFSKIQKGERYRWSDLEKELMTKTQNAAQYGTISFVANGETSMSSGWRSPWYDREEKRRSPRDKAINIDIDYIGSGDVVFNPMLLKKCIEKDVKKPLFQGEIRFIVRDDKISQARFSDIDSGYKRLSWWGELFGRRPAQNHNYIIGCDISLGTGVSNSVASVFDCDLNMKIGSYVNANISPTSFAEYAYALGQWIGGSTGKPFLIWEAQGCGGVFSRRIVELGYEFLYHSREEKGMGRRRKMALGWYPSGDNKLNMLSSYESALDARFKQNSDHPFINPDESSLREAEDYVFYTGGSGIGPSSSQSEEGGAKMTHGDRVIADGLCNLARFDQPRAATEFSRRIVDESNFAYRRLLRGRKSKEQSNLWLM